MSGKYSFDGLLLSKLQESMLSYLVTSIEEYDEFMLDFWRGTTNCQNVDISNYLIYKVDKMNLTFSKFSDLFDIDPKNSFQVLTQRPVTQSITNAIINEINNGNVTLLAIFDNYKKDKLKTILRIVKDCI